MTGRRYTLEEIDQMRSDAGKIMSFVTWAFTPNIYAPRYFFIRSPEPERIESQLRTAMMGGVSPAELAKKAAARYAELEADLAEQQADEKKRCHAQAEAQREADEHLAGTIIGKVENTVATAVDAVYGDRSPIMRWVMKWCR